MKRRLALMLIALCLCGLLPVGALAAADSFTLMVYLCGTDLETDGGSATDDLLEMVDAGLDPDGPVRVIVETGGTVEWWVEDIDPELNERWMVGDGEIHWLEGAPRQSMGSARTLADFVAFCVEEYPADRYGLILWDHGGGSTSGVCFDEFDGAYLTAYDIHNALGSAQEQAGDFRLDFIAFDACLMASFEMANYVKDYADTMIASEELAPGTGFDYRAILSALKEDPSIPMDDLGRVIVDSFLAANLEIDPDDYMTLSMLDLTRMDALTAEIEAVSQGLSVALDSGDLRDVSRSRQNMRSFGDFDRASSDMVDLRQFIEVYASLSGADTKAIEAALDDVVAYSRYTENNLDHVGGLSILLPLKTREEFASYAKHYDPLERFPQYTDFITGYVELLNGGSYVFGAATPQEATGWSVFESLGDNVSVFGSGIMATIGQVDEAAEAGEEAFGEDGILAYSLELSEADMENLAYVEGNLMIDISDEDVEAYIDLGYLQNAVIDWDNNAVYSLFDGTWPVLEDQYVHITDQIVTERTRRSLIDVTVNGLDVYLLVVFDEARPDGEIIGYTEGYNENGMPARGYERLVAGDVIIPQYYLYVYDDDGEESIERFEGEPIPYDGTPLAFGYEPIAGEDMAFAYTFCLNDIFGDYHFTDFLFFSL